METNVILTQQEDLPLSADGQLEFDSGASLASRLLEEQSIETDWYQFRVCRINQPTINWKYPTAKNKQEDDNYDLIPGHVFFDSNNQPVTHQILALRGIIIKFGFGFSLYDGVEKKAVCRTIGLSEFVDGKEIYYKDSTPLIRPVRAPFRSAEKWNEYSPFLKERSNLTLYGSRQTITLNSGEEVTRTCKLCVEKGEHIIDHGGGKKSTCGLVGQMMMVVFEVACQISDPKNPRSISLRWVKPHQLNVTGLDKPFVLRINSLPASTTLSKLGSNEYDTAIKPRPYLPQKLYTIYEYINWLGSRQGRMTWRNLKGGHIAYQQPIEVYCVEKIGDKPTYLPVIAQTEGSKDWITTAWQIYMVEKNTDPQPAQETTPINQTTDQLQLPQSEIPDVFAVS